MLADRLRQVKDVLENAGWCKRTYRSDDGCFCIMGAVYNVHARYKMPVKDAVDALCSVLYPGQEGHEGWITAWNDNIMRTKDEVLDLLDKAIANADTTVSS